MASNPQDGKNDSANPPSLASPFGTGLFNNTSNSGAGLFGGTTSKGNNLFSNSTPPSQGLFGSMGQSAGSSMFSSSKPAPQFGSNPDASKGTGLFGGLGSKSTLFPNNPSPASDNNQGIKLEQTTSNPNPLGLATQNSDNKSLGLFGGQRSAGTSEKNLATTTTGSAGTNITSLFGGNNATLNFGSQKEEKKDQGAQNTVKKDENKSTSLFPSAPASNPSFSLFGNKDQGSNMFNTPQTTNAPTEQKQGESKSQAPNLMGNLFNNSGSSAQAKQSVAPKKPEGLFGNIPSSTSSNLGAPNVTKNQNSASSQGNKLSTESKQDNSNAEKAKTTTQGSLFGGNNIGSLFGSVNSSTTPKLFGSIGQNTPINQPVPPLFGSASNPPSAQQSNSPAPQKPLFGGLGGLGNLGASATPKPALFGDLSQPPKSQKPSPPLNLSTDKVQKTLVKESSNEAKAASISFIGSQKPLVSPEQKPQIKPPSKEANIMLPQLKKQAPPSLFGSPNNLASSILLNKPKPEPESHKNETPVQPTLSKPTQGFKSFSEKQSGTFQNLETEQPKVTVRSNQTQNSSLFSSKGPNTQSKGESTKVTTGGQSKRTFSFLKQKEVNTSQILDYKALKEEEKSEMFNTFLSQNINKIITSIKMYFTVRTETYKPKEHSDNNSQKERFFIDLTNLLAKNLGVTEQSWKLLSQFIRRVVVQEKYEKILFKENSLNIDYFRNQMIYIVDYSQKYYLNEMSSKQLQFLVEKIVNKWNIEKVSLINFLFNYSDLLHKPSDLYYYLFKHLLECDKKLIESPNQNYKVFIRDFETITKKKLIELITYYNARLKDYRLIPNVEDLKTIIKLIEFNKDQSVNEISLKILLNAINFKQHKEVSPELFEAIKQTKSFVLMPLRALVYRLNPKKQEFLPNPKDLYKYIRGDEWIDWFDIYLSDSSREGLQFQVGQPEQILQSLCTISGRLLLQRMLSSKKGILKFFNLLRDENMVNLYYRLLQVCIYDEKSISQIDEFYFKKMHFNLQYQEILEYIINFNENQKHANEDNILSILEVKISLIVKILEVSPEKLVELQRYLFYHDYGRQKKFKTNEIIQDNNRVQGEKIIHLFLDTINITSLKNISNKILHKIFKVLTHLLKNQQTEKIVLNALKINRPSFHFMQNALHPLTLNSINDFVEQVISGSYLHDLVFSYTQCKEEEIRMEVFYPFRYKDSEYNNLLRYERVQGNEYQLSFSIYWLNQIIKILNKQKFNPYLIHKILEKFYIIPYNASNEHYNNQNAPVLYQKTKQLDNKIPTIFENIISSLNQLTIWQEISRILEHKIIRKESKLDITNKFIMTNGTKEGYRRLLYTLKLIRIVFRLSDLQTKHEETSSNHFIVKSLSAINFLSKSKINSLFASNVGKYNILLSLISNLQYEHECIDDSYKFTAWEAEQTEQGQIIYKAIIAYINNNKRNIDFQQANNFLKRPNNDLYESQNSIISISLELIIEVIKLSPQCSIQYNLTALLPLKQDEKLELRSEIVNKFFAIMTLYVQDPRLGSKIIEFIYNLKYNCGANKLHASLSTRLFDEFIKINRRKERSPKFNAILCKYLLKQLEDNKNINYESFTEKFIQDIITNFQFKDSFINNYHQFRDTREIGRMIKSYHLKQYSFFNLNQIERIIEQRAIIQIGHQFQYLKVIVDIIMIQILRRKHTQSLINCIYLFNTLLLNNNLILLEKDLPNQFKSSKASNGFDYNQSQPRLYLRDPIELYITQTRNSKKKGEVQCHQKNNIIEWLLDKCQILSQKITGYVKFILTINKYLYSNNPISFTVQRNDIANLELFSHLSLGKMNFTATELFGKSSSDAIDAVQGIASNLINRLIEIRKSGEYNSYVDPSFKEGLKILGFCLEWLRGKERYGENASLYLVKKIQKNYLFLLPENNHFISAQSIKVLLSTLSMGEKYFTNEAKAHIHETIYGLIERYWQTMQKGFIEGEARSLGELVQQALSILLIIPPQKNETDVFELLINIWVKQRNYQFFFNESRLILELTSLYPQEIVKLQPLTRCEIVANLGNFYSRYEENQRRFDSIAWTWVVKVATELVNHPLSILVISQVSIFFKHYKDRFIALFELSDKISKSYVEDLQAALQLLVCLFSHDLWINFNRKLAEELTYLLSHKLIKVFVAYAQGKLAFLVGSNNDKNLSLIKCSGTVEEQFNDNFDNLIQDNMFITEMKIKMSHCVRNYCILMKKAFKSSHYVEKYFETPVFENFKYFSSFWDIFNKHIIALFVFFHKQFKIWNSVKKLNDTLSTLYQCYNAPHTFVENGYLSSIIELPKNQYELFSDIYLQNYLISQLAAIHYLKEKLYVNKYNNLLSNHIDTFGKKIKEHVDSVKVECRKISMNMNLYINDREFLNISELIEGSKALK